MLRFWVIAPYNADFPDEWEKVWKYDLEQGIISIGWQNLGNVSSLSEDQLVRLIQRKRPKDPPAKVTRTCRMLRHFYHSVKPGDVVIARRGRKMIAAFGTVTRKAFFDPSLNQEAGYPNHLGVKWHDLPRYKQFSEIVFPIHTIYEISRNRYRELSGAPVSKPVNVEEQSLTDDEIDVALKSKRLRIGMIQTDSYEALVRQRRGQARIHKLTVEHYGSCCAVCDVTDPRLLIASHIVGWAEAPKHRGDLSNVICLCRAHDALFEAGYWSIADNRKILKRKDVTSKTIRRLLDPMISIRLPLEFPPSPAYLKRHRKKVRIMR